ncbi:MAG: hypothetical protein IT373_30320 [Polyangiaceae bacterium]|nr:hypothetical protein [Polyangiaceae bacterium]
MDPDDECPAYTSCGGAGACEMIAVWSKTFGGGAYNKVTGFAVDSSGNSIVAGYFEGAVDFGGGSLVAVGVYDGFVAKFDSSGAHVWSKRFGNQDVGATGVAVDAADNVVLVGTLAGTMDLGGGALTSTGTDAFAAKLSPAGGHVWSRRFDGTSLPAPRAVATSAAGDVFIGGNLAGTVDFGCGALASAGGDDVVVAKLTSAGACGWSRRFGDTSNQRVSAIAVDVAGDPVVTGNFDGALAIDGIPLTASGTDMFVAKLAGSNGVALWAKGAGSSQSDEGQALAVTASNEVVVGGYYAQSIDLGGGSLPVAATGSYAGFVVKYDGVGGHAWSKGFINGNGRVHGLAVGAAQAVLLSGWFTGYMDLGSGPLTSGGGVSGDAFLGVLSADGTPVSSDHFTSQGDAILSHIAVDGTGAVVVVGPLRPWAVVELGNGPLVGTQGELLAKFLP